MTGSPVIRSSGPSGSIELAGSCSEDDNREKATFYRMRLLQLFTISGFHTVSTGAVFACADSPNSVRLRIRAKFNYCLFFKA